MTDLVLDVLPITLDHAERQASPALGIIAIRSIASS